MAFSYNDLGALVQRDPAAAHAKLKRLFDKHHTRQAVAKACGANQHTVGRWLRRLQVQGYPDPRQRELPLGAGGQIASAG